MKVGVIGSGALGPDLAYGFLLKLARVPGSQVILCDHDERALAAGRARVHAHLETAVARGKLAADKRATTEQVLVTTSRLADLAPCALVLEAATEDAALKQKLLADLEGVVSAECLIGSATSGIPRKAIASRAARPERYFVTHPFFPAHRSVPVEVVSSGDALCEARLLRALGTLGKVPVLVADVPCFAADDIFVNYCAEAARIVAEGIATPAQVDAVAANDFGGSGPFCVMDLTGGTQLNMHCLALLHGATSGNPWFAPLPIFAAQGQRKWLADGAAAGEPADDRRSGEIRARLFAVVLSRALLIVEREVCVATELDWLTRTALGFKRGVLELAHHLGLDVVRAVATDYARKHPGFELPACLAPGGTLPPYYKNVSVRHHAGPIAEVTIFRPEVLNALDTRTLDELDTLIDALDDAPEVYGVLLTGVGGNLAGADIKELAALETFDQAVAKSRRGQQVLDRLAAMSKPVVAALDGAVLGGGAELAMACHGRVAGPQLVLGQPEVNLGIIPGYGGTQRLPRLIGVERAVELLRNGKPIKAAQACALGWAEGSPVEDYLRAARELLGLVIANKRKLPKIAAGPLVPSLTCTPLDLGHHSRAIDAILCQVLEGGLTKPLVDGLQVEAEGFGRCLATRDYRIGMQNFLEHGPRVNAVFCHD